VDGGTRRDSLETEKFSEIGVRGIKGTSKMYQFVLGLADAPAPSAPKEETLPEVARAAEPTPVAADPAPTAPSTSSEETLEQRRQRIESEKAQEEASSRRQELERAEALVKKDLAQPAGSERIEIDIRVLNEAGYVFITITPTNSSTFPTKNVTLSGSQFRSLTVSQFKTALNWPPSRRGLY